MYYIIKIKVNKRDKNTQVCRNYCCKRYRFKDSISNGPSLLNFSKQNLCVSHLTICYLWLVYTQYNNSSIHIYYLLYSKKYEYNTHGGRYFSEKKARKAFFSPFLNFFICTSRYAVSTHQTQCIIQMK